MAQSKVTSYYNTRKKRTDNKTIKSSSLKHGINTETSFSLLNFCDKVQSPRPVVDVATEPKAENIAEQPIVEKLEKKPKKVGKSKREVKETKTKQSKSKNVSSSKTNSDIRAAFEAQASKASVAEHKDDQRTNVNDETFIVLSPVIKESILNTPEKDLPRTPKRNLSDPEEPNVDSKKKKKEQDYGKSVFHTPGEKADCSSVRKKLVMQDDAPLTSKGHETAKALKRQDILKSLGSVKLNELKEQLKKFDRSLQKSDDHQTNKYKLTSPILPKSEINTVSSDIIKKKDPAYQSYAHLSSPAIPIKEKETPASQSLSTSDVPSLTLPYKYKLLFEAFRSCDTVVSILFNRKELCTFQKVKNGVQKMTRKLFTMAHLGQIKTVFPLAYDLSIEKNSSAFINRSPGASLYEMIVNPNLKKNYKHEETTANKSGETKSKTCSDSQQMTPACLVERRNIFSSRLINIVKKHHQDFLSKMNPPVIVPMDKLTKWHLKFPLDSVPDIEVSPLPEFPNQQKISTAKDVLDKIRGTKGEKVENALRLVASKYASVEKASTATATKSDTKVTTGLLKGLSLDILQKVRARESVKIVEDMTRSPEDKKRIEMLERIPELVRILRLYFITERRAAVSLEDATKKLMDSYHAALTPDEVQKHIQLMSDIFPSWLTLIPIRKGMFLKIDKNMDINTLLSNMPKQ